ncbi:MAG: thioredoxin [Spirochaetota bacterium]
MSAEVEITEKNFESEVLQSDKPVLVDFWAEWCMPCKMLSPVVAEIAEEHGDKIKVGSVDVDQAGSVASKYGIASIPTLIIFKDGEPVNQRIGAGSKQAIEEFISDYI